MQNESYSQAAVNRNEGAISRMADRLVRRLLEGSKNSPSRNTVDAFTICGLFSLEVVYKIGFDKDLADVSDHASLSLLNAIDDTAYKLVIGVVLPFLRIWGIGCYVPGFIGHVFRQHRYWEQTTRTLLKQFGQESHKDSTQKFLATPFILSEDTFLGRRLTEDEAVEESLGLVFAGSGTTSTTLIYTIYNLSRPENRQHQLDLRRELLAAGEHLQDVKDLPYLNAVIKETMRLNPTIISTLPRVVDTSITLQDYNLVLPPGTVVGMQNYVHQRDPLVFPQPHEFRPERWLDDSGEAEKALTPFSLGTRNCIGQNLARVELYLAISRIFRKLDIKLNAFMREADMEMVDRFNVAPKGKKLLLDVEVLSETLM